MWFIFGWGTKSKSWDIGNGQQILATWSYFHLIFFPIAWNVKWHLIGDKRSEDRLITYEEAKRLSGINNLNIGRWAQYGLLYAIGYLVASYFLISFWGPAIYTVVPLAIGCGMYVMLEERRWRLIYLYSTLLLSIALAIVFYWLSEQRTDFSDPLTILGTVLLAALLSLVVVIIWKGIASKVTSPIIQQ